MRRLTRTLIDAFNDLSRLRRGLIIFGAVVLVAVVFVVDIPGLVTLRHWSDSVGAWFVVLFWLLYVGITQFPLPRTALTLTSGILFGPGNGLIIAITATTVSAAVSLLLIRGLFGTWMRGRLQHPLAHRIEARLEARGWLAVGSLRMIGAVPFSLLNYVAALTPVKLLPFTVATFVGSLPGTTVTVFFGDTLTGHASPIIIVATVVLALLGLSGLLLDSRLPLRNSESSATPQMNDDPTK